jgi:DNA-binding transcriptional LysR family regulator
MMANLVFEPLFDERMAIVSWPTSVFSDRKAVDLAELIDAEWCMPLPNTVIRERFEEECAKRKLSFPVNRVDGGIATILGSWMPNQTTSAIVLCPYSLAREKIEAGDLFELPVQFDKALPPTGITHRADSRAGDSAGLLMDEFRRISAAGRTRR